MEDQGEPFVRREVPAKNLEQRSFSSGLDTLLTAAGQLDRSTVTFDPACPGPLPPWVPKALDLHAAALSLPMPEALQLARARGASGVARVQCTSQLGPCLKAELATQAKPVFAPLAPYASLWREVKTVLPAKA